MIIARQKKEENTAEYLLYMWQVEDLLRACRLDTDAVRRVLVSRFGAQGKLEQEIYDWYDNLCQMMRNEHVEEKGHLQINKNVLDDLNEWHLHFLQSDLQYEIAYQKILPIVADLRMKGSPADVGISDMEICFNLLYMTLIMRMQKREISADTQKAVQEIGEFVKLLIIRKKQKEEKDLEEEKNK